MSDDPVSAIESPECPQMDSLCRQLAELAPQLNDSTAWPGEQLRLCAGYGVFRWFVPRQWGGMEWSGPDIARGYLRLGSVCLTTTFVITQWVAAVRRILTSDNHDIQQALLPDLVSGARHTTVGISHLTTSRRHLQRPVLRATETATGFELDGYCPWVTGAPFADDLVVGATLESAEQILVRVPATTPGIEIRPSESLVALSASRTGSVGFQKVAVGREQLMAGPDANVMASAANRSSSGTGGLQTSTLALALARAAIDFMFEQAAVRKELEDKARELQHQWNQVGDDLFQLADGHPVCSSESLRTRSNSLVLRSTQAALVAARGAGFVTGHPVGRWCQEALFFLVWSCPQSVLEANLCELAGIES